MNNSSICYIFGGGDRTSCDASFAPDDLVIAADAGYDYLQELGLCPDVILGDFDSTTARDIPSDSIRYPKEKDDTDLLLAIQYGLEHSYENFCIYGALGGRLDHTLGNIQALSYLAEHGATGTLMGEGYALRVIKDGKISFAGEQKENRPKNLISVFSLSDVSEDVTISGLKYEVENVNLTRSFPLGVSNEFTGKNSFIQVKKGTICILWYL